MNEASQAPKIYEPPTIEERTPISLPLIGSASIPTTAAFRPV
jgi:hypothetical protein